MKRASGGRIPPEIEREILDAIREHLPKLEEGIVADWSAVRERWPSIIGPPTAKGPGNASTDRRFFRWVKKVRDPDYNPTEARAIAALPAVPSVGEMIRISKDSNGEFDVLGMLRQLLTDAGMWRAYAVKFDENGVESIKNPVYFDTSFKRRLDLIHAYIAVYQEIYDLRQMQVFFDEIIDIIAVEISPGNPEVSKRVLDRLRQLKERREEVRPVES
jgi:hypothetical protein